MSKNRYLNTKFWDDGYVINLDPIEKLLFIYCLTNPLTNICGIYEISLKRIAFDTGIDKDMVIKILDRFEENNKIKYNNGWIAIKNFIKHQAVNPKIEKGIDLALNECPDNMIEWIKNIGYHSLSKPLNYSNSNSNSNSNSKVKQVSINKEDINIVYNAYPTRCPIKYRSTSKGQKCKNKIESLIKKGKSPSDLIELINLYVEDCKKTNTWISNFEVFLNNLPDKDSFNIVPILEENIKESVKTFIYDDKNDMIDELMGNK